MANHLAVRLDRTGAAEMSCIAGVGGDVPSLVARATSGRPIVVLDGCALHCARHCLNRHGVEPDLHINLGLLGVQKIQRQDFDPDQAAAIEDHVRSLIQTRFDQAANIERVTEAAGARA